VVDGGVYTLGPRLCVVDIGDIDDSGSSVKFCIVLVIAEIFPASVSSCC